MGRSSGLGVRDRAGGSGPLQPEPQHCLHMRAETSLGSCGGHSPSTQTGSHLSHRWQEGLSQLAGTEQAKPGTRQGPQGPGQSRSRAAPPAVHTRSQGLLQAPVTAVTGVVLKEAPPPPGGWLLCAPAPSLRFTSGRAEAELSPKGRSLQAETGPTRKLHA